MVAIDIVYEGQLHCRSVHTPSGTVLQTDAPKDNMGKGESFSPTDLVATALGTCMLTVMGIAARTLGVNIEGTKATVTKEMMSQPERRIARLSVSIHVPAQLSEAHQHALRDAAMRCPVHKSLHPDLQTPIEFTWG